MKTLIDDWNHEIHGQQIAFRLFQKKDRFIAGARPLGGEELVREYLVRPSRDEVKADFTEDFHPKKVLLANDPFVEEAIDRSAKNA